MRVLITGGTGFLGSLVVRELVKAGSDVHLFALENDDLSRLGEVRERIARHDGDLRNYSTVRKALEKVAPGLVVHLAAAGVTDPFLPPHAALRHNVAGTLNLLEALKGKTSVIAARTPGEYSAMNVYAASKAAAWQFLQMYHRTHGLPLIGVMPFQTYGPGQPPSMLIPSAIQAALAGEDFPMTHGQQVRDWVFAEDVAVAFRHAAESDRFEGETVEVGSGTGTRILDVVEEIYRTVGRGGKPLPGNLQARPGEVERQIADADDAERLIGWKASVSLSEGLRRTIESAR